MNVKQTLAAAAGTAVVFLALDAAWLTVMGERLYRPVLGPMMADKLRLGPAAAFYVIYILGVVMIAVTPALAENSLRKAAVNGALLGFVAYAAYDLTNQATLRHWSSVLTAADLAWGTALTAAAACAGLACARAAGR